MAEKKRTFTLTEDNALVDRITNRTESLSACFMEFAKETGHSAKSVQNHYYRKLKPAMMAVSTPLEFVDDEEETPHVRVFRKWTEEENQVLLRHLKNGIGNFHACFAKVAEEIDRTPIGVAAHWYAVLSRRHDVRMIITASEKSILINRKNGKGVESNSSIWRRILTVLRTLHI